MRIDYPAQEQLPQLQGLWLEAFGEEDGFWCKFLATAFAPDRCRCITRDGQVAAALYWTDCHWNGRNLAYIFGVATKKTHRHQGLCRRLMEDTLALLTALGYQGALLVPVNDTLGQMYRSLGWEYACGHEVLSREAAAPAIPVQPVDPVRYLQLRKALLPETGVAQGEDALRLVESYGQLYAGDGFLLAAVGENHTLQGLEYLGDPALLPGILVSLGKQRGNFRVPGDSVPFAMFQPLAECPPPGYFAFAFD